MADSKEKFCIDGGQDFPVPAHLNFGKFIFEKIKNMGNEVALQNVTTGEKYTYKELTQEAVNLAVSFQKQGMGVGDIVILGINTLQYIPAALAVIFTGATLSPIHLRIGRVVLEHQLTIAKPSYVICNELFWNKFGDILEKTKSIKTVLMSDGLPNSEITLKISIPMDYDVNTFEPVDVLGQKDVAVIYYSSGTSGMPKAVQLTHLNCIILSLGDDIKSFQTGFHCRNWTILYYDFKAYTFIASGKKMLWSEVSAGHETVENLLYAVEKYQIDIVFTMPLMIYELAKFMDYDKYDLSFLKVIQSRSAPLQANTIENLKKKIPSHIKIIQAYGMTEIGEVTSQIRVLNSSKELKLGSVGKPCRGVIIKVKDPKTGVSLPANTNGEICYKGAALMKGYIDVDPFTYLDKDGFFKTGDLGYFDEDGDFYVIDRLKDVMIVDCHKIFPIQIESLLQLHSGVQEAGVVGKPHLVHFHLPTAFIVKNPESHVTEQELIDYVKAEGSSFMQLLGGVYFISKLPRNDRGKILRRQLKEMLDSL